MAVILALITSGLWGTADFFGGLAARRESLFRVMLWVHGLGLVAVGAAAPFIAEEVIVRDLAVGALAGLIGLGGMLLLYWGLSRGPMAVVAPLSALTSALVPVAWGFSAGDDTLSSTAWGGLLLGLGAVVAISWQRESLGHAIERVVPAVVGAGILAGACFGSLVLLYDTTSEASAPWPIVSGRVLTTVALLALALYRAQPLTPGTTLAFAAVAGLGDTFANVTLLLATSQAAGSAELSIVGVVAAFYPAATVMWARFALGETLGPVRIAGLAMGAGAVVLMAVG